MCKAQRHKGDLSASGQHFREHPARLWGVVSWLWLASSPRQGYQPLSSPWIRVFRSVFTSRREATCESRSIRPPLQRSLLTERSQAETTDSQLLYAGSNLWYLNIFFVVVQVAHEKMQHFTDNFLPLLDKPSGFKEADSISSRSPTVVKKFYLFHIFFCALFQTQFIYRVAVLPFLSPR